MKSKPYKFTKKDFQEFKTECEYWIEYFGLKNWDWLIEHKEPSDSDAVAEYFVQYEPRNATIRLALTTTNPPLKNEIKQFAFHEVCHVLLVPVTRKGANYFSQRYMEESEHEIIAVLENTVFKDYLKK